jgi:ketosteroid isomerase-like protein
MSQENVEIVRRVFEATTRRDAEAVAALYDPSVEMDTSRATLGRLVAPGVYRGHEGVQRFLRTYNEAWQQMDYEIEELIDAGDQVVSVVNNRGRGRSSGIEVELRLPGVWTIIGGKIIRVVFFTTREEALEAAGLSE